jgi:S-adenosylmethionine:tRNA ribosyltransferase-isomerase
VNVAASRRSRTSDTCLLVVDAAGRIDHRTHRDLPSLLRPGDLVVANDAATLPASLTGVHLPTGADIEVRLAGHHDTGTSSPTRFTAIVFGAGDYRTPTEHRPTPPMMNAGDRLVIASLRASVLHVRHPRLIELAFEQPAGTVWERLSRHGRPIQYAHVPERLAIWDSWTSIAARPVAFEAPSAGFVLDWSMLHDFRCRGVRFATLTHAAGISSTGDPELDACLPFDEVYVIPSSTAALVASTKAAGGRVVAIGTTVVRALEHAARHTGHVAAGDGVATGRIGPRTRLQIVDAIVSGVHEPGTSHNSLLRAFQEDEAIGRMWDEAERSGYLTHEFGDAVLVMRRDVCTSRIAA